ncbi:hypothetical protein [Azotobacter vinelandii]|uniref:hypothetical protein n=1 Tax=Azotobacter vinelandii TaxID=354 RepID=UPI0009230D89|nr:hypothetical protein [Azotobacter vinelandii]WKN20826.1 hypothetical protein AVAEIV_003851 [Azotobacter vinelandii]SFY16536.1 hypothetical protein SAMN04244547_04271 [Azotobacter vinelandii]
MKLILKRVGADPNSASPALIRPGMLIDDRPFALHAEDGEALPHQIRTNMSSEPGGPVTVTVVFMVDGDLVSVEGP